MIIHMKHQSDIITVADLHSHPLKSRGELFPYQNSRGVGSRSDYQYARSSRGIISRRVAGFRGSMSPVVAGLRRVINSSRFRTHNPVNSPSWVRSPRRKISHGNRFPSKTLPCDARSPAVPAGKVKCKSHIEGSKLKPLERKMHEYWILLYHFSTRYIIRFVLLVVHNKYPFTAYYCFINKVRRPNRYVPYTTT